MEESVNGGYIPACGSELLIIYGTVLPSPVIVDSVLSNLLIVSLAIDSLSLVALRHSMDWWDSHQG